MRTILISMVIFIMALCGRVELFAMETFRFPLPEFQGQRKLPVDEFLKKKVGVFRNVSTVRIEINGSATYGEETNPKRQGETLPVKPGGYFTLNPACVPSYEALPFEPFSNVKLPDGHFQIIHYFIRGKSPSSFLVEGDGGLTLTMHLRRSMIDWYPAKPERITEPSVTITEATLFVEAEKRIGDVKPRKIDPFRLPVVFSGGHINFAWGYQDNGFLIDADGNVFLYDNNCRGPRYLSGNEPLTDELMRDRFTMTKLVKRIDSKQFRNMKKLIAKAAEGKISGHRAAYDAGSSGFTAYIYDEQHGTYVRVNLGCTGDFETINDSPAANILKKWLIELRKEVSQQAGR
jgi:hypothetical protein